MKEPGWSFVFRKTYTWSWRKSSHSWNPADFRWNLLDFMQISGEIQQISQNLADFRWNPADFMKSSGFHMKSGGFHVKSTYKSYKSNISRKTSVLRSAVGRLCHVFTWNPPDFHEIRQISKDQLPGMVSPMFSLRWLAPLIAASGFIAIKLEKIGWVPTFFKEWFLNIYPKDSLWKV